MGRQATSLYWRPELISNLMNTNGIRNRSELADRLESVGVARTTVYRAFTEDWRGTASTTVLAAVAFTFAVPLAQLVVEPFVRRHR